ncbi:MAG: hypothetical protein JO358_20425 [Alphaproteobacteria bacterium]|nr:hypothetical protein [Alphaproteobacteria bacterium]
MPDLSSYAARIHDEEDRPLFDDATKAASAGALRAAYVMLWLSCAESIKRRFREAEKRDGAAGRIVGDLDHKEKDHKSVDKFLLEKAKEYGFLTDTAYTILLNIYEMRCVYGHPYEQEPTPEQVIHAAAMVVEHLLAEPVRLRHGYCKTLLNSLLQDKNYLDDQQSTVDTFVAEVVPRVDERIYGWLLDNYWKKLEKIADDPSMKVFLWRGIFFTRAFLALVGPVISADEWHAKVGSYPKILARAFKRKALFQMIGERAQDSLVGSALDQAADRSSVLQYLDRLMDEGALTDRQKSRFLEHIDKMPIAKLRSSKLSTAVCLKRLLVELKSHDWYRQQPAVDVVAGNGPEDIRKLDTANQIILGRNILQVADGDERSAKRFLQTLADSPTLWPKAFIKGIALECFVNEGDQLRLKCDHLKVVLKALAGLDENARLAIVEKLEESISGATPKDVYLSRTEFEKTCDELAVIDWARPLKQALEARKSELVITQQQADDDE